ncbi:MAG: tRNA preQ1(34) S-adenosylmethionine ribosyltransferase-isomerase QueA [Candidatus Roizmanbacteria bacterium]|nr:tRNA preQ1(34) S-adenosylmethionine ribosyltransferase-isomerase QueA [Candidatus Roizmanbacteria bacterium]
MKNRDLYSYDLPDRLIAKEPVQQRDGSKLLVYDTKTGSVTFDVFRHIADYLPAKSHLVCNTASVTPARITLHKQTGGKVVCLFLVNEPEQKSNEIRMMVDRKITINDTLLHNEKVIGTVVKHSESGIFIVSLHLTREALMGLLNKDGVMPIPLYLRDTTLSPASMKDRYQTIFAQPLPAGGATAAPTASLHFTNEVFKTLEKKGIQKSHISLLVGLGTFAPLTQKHIEENKLHEEWYDIPVSTQQMLSAASDITAVGTTVVRTLESYAVQKKPTGTTDIFIHPPYHFAYVRHLITNFHLPKSSLMMLVEAFLQDKHAPHHLVELYHMAIQHEFRFYSLGDTMLIL